MGAKPAPTVLLAVSELDQSGTDRLHGILCTRRRGIAHRVRGSGRGHTGKELPPPPRSRPGSARPWGAPLPEGAPSPRMLRAPRGSFTLLRVSGERGAPGCKAVAR